MIPTPDILFIDGVLIFARLVVVIFVVFLTRLSESIPELLGHCRFLGLRLDETALLIRPPNCNESMFGASLSNEGNAHLAVKLNDKVHRDAQILDARYLSRRGSVLIITPYLVQKNYL